MKPIEIFKVGTHTATNGQSLSFDQSMLADAVAAYQPNIHEAPIVVGHPKDNHPAFGWIDHLELTDDGVVLAHPKQIDADFAELVKKGNYKKRSASWYSPDSPANPTPGKLYLRHVGFLGAMPPALKGLGDVQFNETEEGVVEFAESPYLWTSIGNAFRALREWVIGKDGVEVADKIISNYQIDDMVAETERLYQKNREAEATLSPITNFSESEMTAEKDQEIEKLKKELADEKSKTTDFSEQQKSIQQREAELAKREITAKVDDLVKQGKVLPAQKSGLVEFMAQLDDGAQIVEFGEGDQVKKVSPRQFMADFLAQQPKLVDFNEHSHGGQQPNGDLSPVEMSQKISAYQQKQAQAGHHISFSEAAAAVEAGKE